jgi:hypothetical protein
MRLLWATYCLPIVALCVFFTIAATASQAAQKKGLRVAVGGGQVNLVLPAGASLRRDRSGMHFESFAYTVTWHGEGLLLVYLGDNYDRTGLTDGTSIGPLRGVATKLSGPPYSQTVMLFPPRRGACDASELVFTFENLEAQETKLARSIIASVRPGRCRVPRPFSRSIPTPPDSMR